MSFHKNISSARFWYSNHSSYANSKQILPTLVLKQLIRDGLNRPSSNCIVWKFWLRKFPARLMIFTLVFWLDIFMDSDIGLCERKKGKSTRYLIPNGRHEPIKESDSGIRQTRCCRKLRVKWRMKWRCWDLCMCEFLIASIFCRHLIKNSQSLWLTIFFLHFLYLVFRIQTSSSRFLRCHHHRLRRGSSGSYSFRASRRNF